MDFDLHSAYKPQGDQISAISKLVDGINHDNKAQTLLGVTGSGKTFTIANVIAQTNKPTLIVSHNKTLAAQLFVEMQGFFPNNCVEYYVSYYDYYQPEAFLPISNTYIAKDLAINEDLNKLRLRSTSALLSGRRDVIVVASVSCIYGIGNPESFIKNVLKIKVGDILSRQKMLFDLVDMLYSRNDKEFTRGTFRVKGDTVDVFLAYADHAFRFFFFDDEVERIQSIDPKTGQQLSEENSVAIFPANIFVTSKDVVEISIKEIEQDLKDRVKYYEERGQSEEAKRISDRTLFDIEMLQELGYCTGVENYSRYLDRRQPGERPYCLMDYFPKDYLLVVDESHVTIPQIRAMWGGDRARKMNLVDHAFRLPAALDNRPLNFDEFESLINQVIYVSATPADYELAQCGGSVVEQVIRPTGLLDPKIEIRPSINQIDDVLKEVRLATEQQSRVLITTLTKRMAEELTVYMVKAGVKCEYIHSEVKTLDRTEILKSLQLGIIDVLVGVNLLREGIDLPEVSLVIILDADKEGFLRNVRSLVQTIGRAARNVNGRVILYADKITASMKEAIEETERRRSIQTQYNLDHNITPKGVSKSADEIRNQSKMGTPNKNLNMYVQKEEAIAVAADPIVMYMKKPQLKALIKETKRKMKEAADNLKFGEAMRLRDEMTMLEKRLEEI